MYVSIFGKQMIDSNSKNKIVGISGSHVNTYKKKTIFKFSYMIDNLIEVIKYNNNYVFNPWFLCNLPLHDQFFLWSFGLSNLNDNNR